MTTLGERLDSLQVSVVYYWLRIFLLAVVSDRCYILKGSATEYVRRQKLVLNAAVQGQGQERKMQTNKPCYRFSKSQSSTPNT
jgi:hypothetical protein